MEKHPLEHLVEGERGFCATPWFNPHGDCVTFAIANEARIADRIDGILTIYRSAVDDRPIGYQIKDVTAIQRRMGLQAVEIQSEEAQGQLISVSMLLLAAYESKPPSISRREAYSFALEQTANSKVKVNTEPVACP